jgi:filamentous hemagglutinin
LLSLINARGGLGDTTINFFGPAYNAEKADEILSVLQNRSSVDPADQARMVLQLQNHMADPVGGFIGNNPDTGGTIPSNSSWIKEVMNVLGGEFTTHNCYANGDPRCKDFWGGSITGKPVMKPIYSFPVSQDKE